jgi:dTDP-4-dehydrorhamnose reductase
MILVLGAKGQLGCQICCDLSRNKINFIATDYDSLDITDKPQLNDAIAFTKPSVIINAAAYTNVNAAENEGKDMAYKINTKSIENIYQVLDNLKMAPDIIHVSTDYVFDGNTNKKQEDLGYYEVDDTNPLNFYGKTKRDGEILLQRNYKNHYIIRTSWLFGLYGANFVYNVTKKILDGVQLSMVKDQLGSPTAVSSLSTVIVCKLLETIIHKNKHKLEHGVYHFSSSEPMSWYDFAKEIRSFVLLNNKNVHPKQITPVNTDKSSKNFIQRPHYSVMNCDKIKSKLSLSPSDMSWREECNNIIRMLSK